MKSSHAAMDLHDGMHEIGLQHQRMTQYYRQMEELIAKGVADHAALESVLDGLIQYTITSFALEENLMEQTGYLHAAEHQKSHDMFMRRLSGYRSSLRSGRYVANELMSLLKIWVTGHIGQQDVDFIAAMKLAVNSAA
jgi:hemerythrin